MYITNDIGLSLYVEMIGMLSMNTGKVVILGGNARSGKTTLAKKLAKNGFNRISFDTLNSALGKGLNMDLSNNPAETLYEFFKTIVNASIDEAKVDGVNTVIDMYDFTPKYLVELANSNDIEIYFLAYPNCNQEEIAFNIKHYAKPTDWIAQVNDTYFQECVERFHIRNTLIQEECEKFGFELIDTSCGEQRYIVLDNLFDRIINNTKEIIK